MAFRRKKDRWVVSHSSDYSGSRGKKSSSAANGTGSEGFKTPGQSLAPENIYLEDKSKTWWGKRKGWMHKEHEERTTFPLFMTYKKDILHLLLDLHLYSDADNYFTFKRRGAQYFLLLFLPLLLSSIFLQTSFSCPIPFIPSDFSIFLILRLILLPFLFFLLFFVFVSFFSLFVFFFLFFFLPFLLSNFLLLLLLLLLLFVFFFVLLSLLLLSSILFLQLSSASPYSSSFSSSFVIFIEHSSSSSSCPVPFILSDFSILLLRHLSTLSLFLSNLIMSISMW